MKIGIDARLINETGVGRYIRNLIDWLSTVDKKNSYVVFLRKNALDTFTPPNARWVGRLADVRWHSLEEQLFMPAIFNREHLDLLHVPYFNVPLLYFGKFVVTIHDLTILHFDTGKASTLPYVMYKIRRLGYYIELLKALFWSEKVLAVSQTTKKEILDHFDVRPQDIMVTYEGVDNGLTGSKTAQRLIMQPYLLYVGNAYPHKNLEVLIDAFSHLEGDSKLVLVGKDDYFYRRLKQSANVKALKERILFKTVASDVELKNLYHYAQACVFPSRMEGFGLPALEALANGCPVITSDIPVFRELLGDVPFYFDPHDVDALTRQMRRALSDSLRTKNFQQKARNVVQKYSWRVMAEQTERIYLGIGPTLP